MFGADSVLNGEGVTSGETLSLHTSTALTSPWECGGASHHVTPITQKVSSPLVCNLSSHLLTLPIGRTILQGLRDRCCRVLVSTLRSQFGGGESPGLSLAFGSA